MFQDPNLVQKIAANPKTSHLLADPSFMAKLQAMQQNPGNVQDLFTDPRMMQILPVLMGIDMDFNMANPGDMDAASKIVETSDEEELTTGKKPGPAATKKAPEPEPEPMDEDLDEEALEKKKAKEAAEKEKALGTEKYKKRQFDEAIKHYQAAWEVHKDITYLNNLGAAYFEKGDYHAAIESCTKAVEEGRSLYADFKTIAKSYARVGTAYEKTGDLEKAVEFYNMSLREHRTPDVVTKLRLAERRKIDEARKAYIDPAKAEEAREEGNSKFKESDWPGAVAAYTEMTKRAPDDPRGYSNRAAAFIKLLEFPSALEDCDAAIKRDPTFVRAYIRRAQAYFGMREYSKCVDACAEALEVDAKHHSGANAREIEAQQQKAYTAMYAARENETEEQTRERLMRDPEVSLPVLFAGKDAPGGRQDDRRLTDSATDHEDHERPRHAGHSAAGAVGPRGPERAHAEPWRAREDPEARRGGCDSGWLKRRRQAGWAPFSLNRPRWYDAGVLLVELATVFFTLSEAHW